MNIGELTATLGVDSHGFDNKIKSITGQLFSLKNILITVAGGYGLKKLSGAFLDAAKTSENYRLRLNALLGSVKEGNRLFDEMSKYAAKVPFQYREIMSSATQLSGVMKGGVDEVKSWMPLIGDLAAASGLGIQKTTEQIIRMYSAGAASADLFRERGILAMLGFQAGVSYTADETRKKLIEAWLDPQSKFRGLTNEMANTWTGLTSMMSDKWFKFRNDLMEAGTFDFLKAGLKTVDNYINQLTETGQFDAFAKDMGSTITKGFEQIILGASLVADAFRGWEMIWQGLKMAFASFSIAVATGLEKIMPFLKKFTEIELKILTLTKQISKEAAKKTMEHLFGEGGVLDPSKIASYWDGVLAKTDEYLEQLALTESHYENAKKLIADIRAEIEKMKIRTPGGGGDLPGVGDDIINFTTEAADNAKKKLKEVGEVADKTFSEEMVDSIQNWNTSFSSMLNDMVWGADTSFKDIARSFGMMLTQMTIQQQIAKPFLTNLSGYLGNLFTPLATPNMVYGHPGAALAWAKGGVFESNRIMEFAQGDIVNRPRLFPMQGGAGLMGEAGPEAIMPLKRMPGGNLGVQSQGGDRNITIHNHNNFQLLDATSVVELMRQIPEAVLIPIQEARDRGIKI